jgi:2-methylcitrate dehydratase PrpD
MDVANKVAEYVWRTNFDDLSTEVVAVTKKAIIDTIGAMIAGSRDQGCSLLVSYIRDWLGRAESTIAVSEEKAPACLAAQANGAMARVLEIDDVNDVYPIHPSAAVIPTCLAVSEAKGDVNGKDLITACAIGHDLVMRLGFATNLSPIASGRNNLSKVIALAAAAGKVLSLDEMGILNSMGIAYSQMAGDLQAYPDGVMTIYIQQGTKAKSAIEAALMARKGITGSRNIFEGQWGFFRSYEPEHDLTRLTEGLGGEFRGLDLSIKLYSACRFTHEAIDLAFSFLSDGMSPNDIDRILVWVNEQCYRMVCDPIDKKQTPATKIDARFSLPFTVAAALERGQMFIDEISDISVKDEKILDLARRVSPVIEPSLKSEYMLGSTIMEIRTKDGQVLSKEAKYPKGNPKNPVSMEDCIDKFRKCVKYSAIPFSSNQVKKMIDMVQCLETVEDVRELAAMLVPLKSK